MSPSWFLQALNLFWWSPPQNLSEFSNWLLLFLILIHKNPSFFDIVLNYWGFLLFFEKRAPELWWALHFVDSLSEKSFLHWFNPQLKWETGDPSSTFSCFFFKIISSTHNLNPATQMILPHWEVSWMGSILHSKTGALTPQTVVIGMELIVISMGEWLVWISSMRAWKVQFLIL